MLTIATIAMQMQHKSLKGATALHECYIQASIDIPVAILSFSEYYVSYYEHYFDLFFRYCSVCWGLDVPFNSGL